MKYSYIVKLSPVMTIFARNFHENLGLLCAQQKVSPAVRQLEKNYMILAARQKLSAVLRVCGLFQLNVFSLDLHGDQA